MKNFFLVLALVVAFAFPAYAQEQPLTVNVDLAKLPAGVRNQVLAEMQKQKESAVPDSLEAAIKNPETVAKYMNEFAVGLREVCEVLSIEVNEFVKTPVGAVTTGVVLYKVLDGGALFNYFKELVMLVPFGLLLLIAWFRIGKMVYFGSDRKMKGIDDNGKKTVRYEFREPTYKNIGSDEAKFFTNVMFFGAAIGICFIFFVALL